MTDDADLEIAIEAGGLGSCFTVHLRYRRENDEHGPISGQAVLDLDRLDEAGGDYGGELTRQVFSEPALIQYFRDAFQTTQARDACLRVRLRLGRGAEALYGLRWERLELPWDDGSGFRRTLALHQQIYFARFLGSFDWRPVRLRRKGERLQVLVAVANPDDTTGGFGLDPIDVDAEISRARRHLRAEPIAPIEPGPDALAQIIALKPPPPVVLTVVRGPGTLNQVVAALQAAEFDVLYLVAHGKFNRSWRNGRVVREESLVFLEGPEGGVVPVVGGELVVRLTELSSLPRLVVLASCQSGGAGDEALSGEEGALSAVGPRLAEAGIPAVLALQAELSMATAGRFFPALFDGLMAHGQVDRAVAAARGLVRDAPDAWVPVLYTRVTHGRVWYVPGLAETPGGRNVGWDGLLTQVGENLEGYGEIGCTPVLGPGLLDHLVGTTRELARRWADESRFALSPYQLEDLPQVAQFLAVTQGRVHPPKELRRRLDAELARRFGALPGRTVDDKLEAARQTPWEPHTVLAQLPFPLYVTTNPDDQLRRALAAQGRDPRAELFPWHNRPGYEWPKSVFEQDPGYEPTPDSPLVYHLFGRLDLPHSIVLTEDDYFEFLLGVPRHVQNAPKVVREALTRSALLFLGFRLDGWDFRVLFRSILAQGERLRLNQDFPHVAAQVAPEEGRNLDTERARDYLQKAFGQADVTIYWGTVDDFLRDLCERARERSLWPYRSGGGR
jgi:SIR2-like domain/CHAT domain